MGSVVKKILKEDSEVTEMGVKVSRLAKLQPKNYLVKRAKKAEKEVIKKEKPLKYQNLFLEAIQEIQNLNWEDLKLDEVSDSNYYVYLPKDINKKLKDAAKIPTSNLNTNLLDKRFQSFLDTKEISSKETYEINIYMEDDRNRTHFPDGLPNWMLGLGLGIKIYRKLLNFVGFIQSSESASEDVKKLYSLLVQSSDVNCALTKNRTLLIDYNIDSKKKMSILGEFVLEHYEDRVFRKKITLNKDIVIDSTLASQVGRTKLQKFFDELYFFYKKNPDRLSFKPETFGKFNDECEPCDNCNGQGEFEDENSEMQYCDDCDGTGCSTN